MAENPIYTKIVLDGGASIVVPLAYHAKITKNFEAYEVANKKAKEIADKLMRAR